MKSDHLNHQGSFSIGLAQWATPQWQGLFFPSGKNPLYQYSRVFSTVEGNTTFYALPTAENVQRWVESVPSGFEFCFKLPRVITHSGKLEPQQSELLEFFHRLSPLEDFLGPFMIQLPAQAGANSLSLIESFIKGLPDSFQYSLEVRHPVFFQKGSEEQQLNQLLARHGIDRVSLDSRALFSARPDSHVMIDAQQKKPKLPVHAVATGQRPIIRFIGRMEAEQNEVYWQPWLAKIPQWVAEGRKPIMFIHTPDNLQAPAHARLFHQQLSRLVKDSGELPAFPVATSQQEDLF